MELSVVIPAYNEEMRIKGILNELNNLAEVKEIIVVVDGNDKTDQIASSFSKSIVLKSSRRLGKGGALIEGIRKASGDVIAYVDADGAVPGAEVVRLARYVTNENVLVIASRWLKTSKISKAQPMYRLFLSRGFNILTFGILGLRLRDTQCGLKVFSPSVKDNVLPYVGTKNLFFDVSFGFNCKRRGYALREIGIEWNDIDGSKINVVKTMMIFLIYVIGLRIINSRFGKYFHHLYVKMRWLFEPV